MAQLKTKTFGYAVTATAGGAVNFLSALNRSFTPQFYYRIKSFYAGGFKTAIATGTRTASPLLSLTLSAGTSSSFLNMPDGYSVPLGFNNSSLVIYFDPSSGKFKTDILLQPSVTYTFQIVDNQDFVLNDTSIVSFVMEWEIDGR